MWLLLPRHPPTKVTTPNSLNSGRQDAFDTMQKDFLEREGFAGHTALMGIMRMGRMATRSIRISFNVDPL